MRAAFADAHVAGGDAVHLAVRAIKQLRGGEARINLDAERLGFGGEKAADGTEGADETAGIAHQRRREKEWQTNRLLFRQPIKTIVADFGRQRPVGIASPFRQQSVERHRVAHRAGKDMRAHFRALLHDDDGNVGRDLLEPDPRREPRRSGADDDDVEFHGFAGGQVGHRCLAQAVFCFFTFGENSQSAARAPC